MAAQTAMMASRISAVSMPRVIQGRCRRIGTTLCGGNAGSPSSPPGSSRATGSPDPDVPPSSIRSISASVCRAASSAGTAVAVTVTGRSTSDPKIIRGPRASMSTSPLRPASSSNRSGITLGLTTRSGSAAARPTASRTLPELVTVSTNRPVRCARARVRTEIGALT